MTYRSLQLASALMVSPFYHPFYIFPSCDDIRRGQMTLWKLPPLAVSERGLIYVRLIRCIIRSTDTSFNILFVLLLRANDFPIIRSV